MFQTERFAKVVNELEVLTIFVERFVLHDWWSSESVSPHCNLLIFYGYLLLLLLYLYILAISCLFELIAKTQFIATLYWALYWSCCADFDRERQAGLLISLLLTFFMSMLSCVEIIQLICVANRVTSFFVGLASAWKRLSIYLYYLAIIHMLSFNYRF